MALAKTRDLKVVAEGVEAEAQQTFLTQIGCNTLQGYLLGRPVTAGVATQLGREALTASA